LSWWRDRIACSTFCRSCLGFWKRCRGSRPGRTPAALVFENLEDGMTVDELLEQFPLSRDQIKAVLEFAARSLDASIPPRCRTVKP